MVIDLPTFLLLCKKTNLIDNEELGQIIEELKKKDNYKFSKNWLNKLLKER